MSRWLYIALGLVMFTMGLISLGVYKLLPAWIICGVFGGCMEMLGSGLIVQKISKGGSLKKSFGTSLLILVFIGMPLGSYMAKEFSRYEMGKHGAYVRGYVFSEVRSKPLTTKYGRTAYYRYVIDGRTFERAIESDNYRAGDSIKILYSLRCPELHQVAR